jgi:purine-binding chemotaxis protein CheW
MDDTQSTNATQQILKKTLAQGFVRKEEEASKEQIQLVVFHLEDEEYAVEISEVREILKKVEIVPIPNCPSFITGIINVRGKIVVVSDLRKLFNLKHAEELESQYIILAEIDGNIYGAIVDDVDEVLRLPKDSIQNAPAIISEKIHADYVRGIVPVEDRLIILLDFKKVFNEEGLSELGEILQKQAEEQRTILKQQSPQAPEASPEEKKEKLEKMVEEHLHKEEEEEEETEGEKENGNENKEEKEKKNENENKNEKKDKES